MKDSEFASAFLDASLSFIESDFLPKIHSACALLTEEEIWSRPNANSNSIGNMLLHLCGNVQQWILSGVGGERDDRQRDLEFSEEGPLPFDDLIEKLQTTVAEARVVLQRLDPESLLERRHIQIYDVTVLRAVYHVVEHFSYHTGQILYAVKMLKDRDLHFYDL